MQCMRFFSPRISAFVSIVYLSSGLVSAAEPVAPPQKAGAVVRENAFGVKPVGAAALSAKRGGDRVANDAQLKGTVTDNHASNLSTGMNVIGDGAFNGSSGLSTVIQNSGNNVLIQSSTVVNLRLK